MSSTRKLKLLFVTTCLGNGGAERHLVRIANSLAKECDVHIAVLRANGSYTLFLSDQIEIHEIAPQWTRRSTLISAELAIRPLARLVDRLEPECLVSFLEPASFAAYRASRRSRHSPARLVAIQNNLKFSLKKLDGLMKRRIRAGVMKSIQTADGVVAISEGVARETISILPSVESKIRTIYNAAFEELPAITSAVGHIDLPKRKSKYQLVACGRLTEQKGFSDLLAAMKLAREKIDVSLWILGTGPLQQALCEQANELGIADAIDFLGFQPDPLLFFRAADLFVLSSWWEGFGNVVVEAMSTATPVVATNCPHGPGEIIDHGKNGWLVPPRSPQALSQQIIASLTDDSLRARLAITGRERSMDFFSAKIAHQYLQFIMEIIDS